MLAARSSRAILPNSPSRTTVTVVSSLISFSASNVLALRPSITTVMVTDRAMAKKMPTHSRMSVWPPAMERVMLTPRVMAAAIISMISIGSAGVCPLAVVICSSRVWLTQRTEIRVISLAYRAAWRFPPSWKNKQHAVGHMPRHRPTAAPFFALHASGGLYPVGLFGGAGWLRAFDRA